MNYTLDCEQEEDGRWIAEVVELPGVMSYGATREEAIRKAEALALRVIADHARCLTFAITDGGMNAFTRPVLMRIPHPVRLLNRLSEPALTDVDICGPICTPIDCLARGVRMPLPAVSDVVGFVNAGAYGYTMSLHNFMSRPRPALLLVDSGELRVV